MAPPQKQGNGETEADIMTCLARLDIINENGTWTCGVPTSRHPYCRNFNHITEEVKAKVKDKIRGLIISTEAAQPLPFATDKLEALASLIHCNNRHRAKQTIESRVEAWHKKLLGFDISIEDEIRTILPQSHSTCASEEDSCLNFGQIGGREVQNITRIIDLIIKPEIYTNADRLESCLRALNSRKYCAKHRDQAPSSLVAEWTSKVQRVTQGKSQEIATVTCTELEIQPSTLSTDDMSLSSDMKQLTLWNLDQYLLSDYDSSELVIVHNINFGTRKNRLKEELISPITYTLDQKKQNGNREGYIYVYQIEGNRDCIKIGCTNKVAKRLKTWEFSCNRRIVRQWASQFVLHVERVEELCHADLSDCRLQIRCAGCLQDHTEWFWAEFDEGIRVAKRWCSWMEGNPYQVTQLELKKESKQILEEI